MQNVFVFRDKEINHLPVRLAILILDTQILIEHIFRGAPYSYASTSSTYYASRAFEFEDFSK
jgi:hypothetical protein